MQVPGSYRVWFDGTRRDDAVPFLFEYGTLFAYIGVKGTDMKYEIGEYGLTRSKEPINYLWYVDGSASGIIFDTYEDAVDAIKKKMKEDEESGRMKENLEADHLIIYFTAGWEEQSILLKMHISGNYDEETLKVVNEYDDRIIVEEI